MQKADNLNDRVGSGSEGRSVKNADPTLISVSYQQLLEEVGGEPLEDPLLTIAQVARELRCSKGHVQNLIRGRVSRTHPLPSVPLGRRRLVRFASLREWVRANEQNR